MSFFFFTDPATTEIYTFPYTTLFRSTGGVSGAALAIVDTGSGATWVATASGRVARLSTRVRSLDRKSTRLNSSHMSISYAVFCLKKKKKNAVQRVDLVHSHSVPISRS